MPITANPGPANYQRDGHETATDLSRDLVLGDAMVFHASQIDRVTLSTGPSEVFAGIVGEPYGATAASSATVPQGPDVHPVLHKWGRNLRCRIEDNLALSYLDPLALSSVTDGALSLATGTGSIVGHVKEAVASGVDQFVACDILPTGSGGGVPSGRVLTMQIADISTADGVQLPVQIGGTITSFSVTRTASHTGNSTLSLITTLGATDGILVVTGGAAVGTVFTIAVTTNNVVAVDDVVIVQTDGASSNVLGIPRVGASVLIV